MKELRQLSMAIINSKNWSPQKGAGLDPLSIAEMGHLNEADFFEPCQFYDHLWSSSCKLLFATAGWRPYSINIDGRLNVKAARS